MNNSEVALYADDNIKYQLSTQKANIEPTYLLQTTTGLTTAKNTIPIDQSLNILKLEMFSYDL